MKKNVVLVGIILLIISIELFIYREISYKKIDEKRINIHDITGSGAKTVDTDVYLNATFIADSLVSVKNDDKNSFYVIFGDEVQYIVYMNNSKAKDISTYLLNNPSKSYRIVGKTKLIPESLESYGRDFVKHWLDVNHDHTASSENHSHEISKEEFYEYFGYVYLDATISIFSEFRILSIIMYIIGGIGLSIILSKVYNKFVN